MIQFFFVYMCMAMSFCLISDEVIICENSKASINCIGGQQFDIKYANYGRLSANVCPHDKPAVTANTNCTSVEDILSILSGECQTLSRLTSCTITATNDLFGDPCPGTYKYLTVGIECQDEVIICENSKASINCIGGQQFDIKYANYGRLSANVCPHDKPAVTANTNCTSVEDILSILSGECQTLSRLTSCTITATNDLFGDPCPGTYKYLTVGIECQDVNSITPRSKQITITFHSYQTSWNKAQAICVAQGGTLFLEDTEEKAIVLAKYRSQPSWPVGVEYHAWIGLHSVETGGSYTWVYGMPSCHEIFSSIHSHWQNDEPEDNNLCGVHHLNTNEWIAKKCQWSFYYFVCEREESTPCTFTEETGTPKSSLQYETYTRLTLYGSSCRNLCLTSVHEHLNCWAATFRFGFCVLYYSADPFLFTESSNIDPSSRRLYLKHCYTSTVDSTDDTTVSANNDATPEEGCSNVIPTTPSFTNTTSTTTTSTASSTATSTDAITTTSIASTAATSTSSASVTSTAPTTTNPTMITTHLTTVTSTLTVSSSSASPSTTTDHSSSTTKDSQAVNCSCSCNDLANLYKNFSNPEFANLTTEEKLEALVTRLRINKSVLSATIRKKTSAEDNRITSVSVGVVAASFMGVVFGLLLAADAMHLINYLFHTIRGSSVV